MQGLGPDHRLEWCIMEHHLRSQPPAQPSTTVPSSTSLHPMVPTTGWSETMQGREECPPCSDWKELEGGSRDCLPSLSPSGFSFSIQVFLSTSLRAREGGRETAPALGNAERLPEQEGAPTKTQCALPLPLLQTPAERSWPGEAATRLRRGWPALLPSPGRHAPKATGCNDAAQAESLQFG